MNDKTFIKVKKKIVFIKNKLYKDYFIQKKQALKTPAFIIINN